MLRVLFHAAGQGEVCKFGVGECAKQLGAAKVTLEITRDITRQRQVRRAGSAVAFFPTLFDNIARRPPGVGILRLF